MGIRLTQVAAAPPGDVERAPSPSTGPLAGLQARLDCAPTALVRNVVACTGRSPWSYRLLRGNRTMFLQQLDGLFQRQRLHGVPVSSHIVCTKHRDRNSVV